MRWLTFSLGAATRVRTTFDRLTRDPSTPRMEAVAEFGKTPRRGIVSSTCEQVEGQGGTGREVRSTRRSQRPCIAARVAYRSINGGAPVLATTIRYSIVAPRPARSRSLREGASLPILSVFTIVNDGTEAATGGADGVVTGVVVDGAAGVVVLVGTSVVDGTGGVVATCVSGAAQLDGNGAVPVLLVVKPSEKVAATLKLSGPVVVMGSVWCRPAVRYGWLPFPPDPFPEAAMLKEVGDTVATPPVA